MDKPLSDEALGRLLRYDPLAAAEEATGVGHYTESDATQALGVALHLSHREAKRKALDALDDTQFSNSLDTYLRIVEEEGFEQALMVPFEVEGRSETFHVWFHPADGVLLAFDTYAGDRVNGGKFYYNWRPSEAALADGSWHSCTSSGGLYRDTGIWAGDHDCREALRFHLRQLRSKGEFVTPWQHQPFLWLLHYGDTKTEGHDHKAITAERVALLPEQVRKAIGRG